MNFEKPYTRTLEGVSTVIKSTPPTRAGQKRLTKGYPAITATYANWLSYTLDFISQNREFERAMRLTHTLFPGHRIRFGGDAGLDDQKLYRYVMDQKRAVYHSGLSRPPG